MSRSGWEFRVTTDLSKTCVTFATPNCSVCWSGAKRRIQTVYTGHVLDADEAAEVGELLRRAIEEIEEAGGCENGFDLVTMFTSAIGKLSDDEVRQVDAFYGALRQIGLKRIMRVLEPGCGANVHVIDDIAIENAIVVERFTTLAEAHAHLDGMR